MIKQRIKDIKDDIPDDDTYDDAIRNLQDKLEEYARLSGSVKATETLQQVLLTRQFLRKLFYQDVEERVQERIRQFSQNANGQNQEISTDSSDADQSDKIPPTFQSLLRIIDKASTQEFFDDDYGYVKQGNIVKVISSELDQTEGEISERAAELSELVSGIYQEEYNNADQDYRDEIRDILIKLIEEPDYDDSPHEEMQEIINQYKIEVHERMYGWPETE